MKRLLLILALGLLCACTAPETPAQAVYGAQADYAAALRVELAYSNLPRCGKPTSPKLCSEVAVIKKLQKADDLAWSALQEAQVAVRTPGFGQSKVTTVVASAKALTQAFVKIAQQTGVE